MAFHEHFFAPYINMSRRIRNFVAKFERKEIWYDKQRNLDFGHRLGHRRGGVLRALGDIGQGRPKDQREETQGGKQRWRKRPAGAYIGRNPIENGQISPETCVFRAKSMQNWVDFARKVW